MFMQQQVTGHLTVSNKTSLCTSQFVQTFQQHCLQNFEGRETPNSRDFWLR